MAAVAAMSPAYARTRLPLAAARDFDIAQRYGLAAGRFWGKPMLTCTAACWMPEPFRVDFLWVQGPPAANPSEDNQLDAA